MGIEVASWMALAVSAYSTNESIKANAEARKDRKRAQRAQQNMAEIQARKERVQAIREARIQRAATLATTDAAGITGGSGELGAISSVDSQLASNISTSNQLSGLSRYANDKLSSASDFEARANIFSTVSGLSGSIFKDAGGFQTIFQTAKYKKTE